MVVPESSFNYKDDKTKIGSIRTLEAMQHPTRKMDHQISSTSKVFVASNVGPADGTLDVQPLYRAMLSN
jgi:hypothetical protein